MKYISEKYKDKQRLCSQRRINLLKNRTKPEIKTAELLKICNFKFVEQKGFIAGDDFCFADFFIPKLRVVLEIDGGYHDTYKQKIRDSYRTEYLECFRGFKVLRLKNEEVFKITIDELNKFILGEYNVLHGTEYPRNNKKQLPTQ